jgi:transposase
MSRPSRYPPEFRVRGVQLYRDSKDRTIAEVARELGVGAETFRKWVRQDEADRGEAPEKPTSAQLAELARLKKENAELRRTNEILRLASSFRPGGRPDTSATVGFVQAHRGEFGWHGCVGCWGCRCRRFMTASAGQRQRVRSPMRTWRRDREDLGGFGAQLRLGPHPRLAVPRRDPGRA